LRWFKHYNTASDGNSFLLLISEKDFESAFIYWWLLEQVSKFEDTENPENRGKITLNFAYFKRELGLNLQRTQRVLQKIAKTFNLEIQVNLDQTIEVFVPKWLELQENRGGKRFTKDYQKNSKTALEVRSKNKEIRIESKEKEKSSESDFHPLIKIWNESSNLSKVVKTNSSRNKKIQAIFDQLTEDEWRKVVQKIASSSFCLGKNTQGWKATFDWLIQPQTYLKVLEGKYDDRAKPTGFNQQRSTNEQSNEFDKIIRGEE
jgi:hypothetical protein